jgi:hypothetical protein
LRGRFANPILKLDDKPIEKVDHIGRSGAPAKDRRCKFNLCFIVEAAHGGAMLVCGCAIPRFIDLKVVVGEEPLVN